MFLQRKKVSVSLVHIFGNGSAGNGPFIVTGFKPGFLLIKRSIGGTDSWFLNDTARASFGNVSSNPSKVYLRPNETSSEGTSSSHEIMLLSNGFKVLSSDTAYNTDGHTYTYYAFAEEPLVASNEDPDSKIIMSEVKVNKVSPRSGTGVQLGDAGDTVTVPASANLTVGGTLTATTGGGIANAALANSSITINGSAVSLGGSVTVGETKPTVTGVSPSTIDKRCN